MRKDTGFTIGDWVETDVEVFDATKEYDELVAPLLDQIEKLCAEHRIPYVFRACIAVNPAGNTAASTRSMAGAGRATPDLLAMFMMEEFNGEYITKLISFLEACQAKYSKNEEGGILVP